jgi:hypothetical protein
VVAGPFAALIIHDPRPKVRADLLSGLFKALENATLKEEFLADPQYGKAYILIMLQAPDVESRLRAVSLAVTCLPEDLRLPGLEAAKRDPDPKVRKEATYRLTRLTSASKSQPLETPSGPLTEAEISARAESTQWGMRAQAAKLAGLTWTPETRGILFQLLHDRDTRVWQVAGRALYLQLAKDESILEELAGMLAGDDAEDQLAALRCLQSQRDNRFGPLWSQARRLAESDDHRVRLAFVRATRQQASSRACRRLLSQFLQDENRAVANEALNGLRDMH